MQILNSSDLSPRLKPAKLLAQQMCSGRSEHCSRLIAM